MVDFRRCNDDEKEGYLESRIGREYNDPFHSTITSMEDIYNTTKYKLQLMKKQRLEDLIKLAKEKGIIAECKVCHRYGEIVDANKEYKDSSDIVKETGVCKDCAWELAKKDFKNSILGAKITYVDTCGDEIDYIICEHPNGTKFYLKHGECFDHEDEYGGHAAYIRVGKN